MKRLLSAISLALLIPSAYAGSYQIEDRIISIERKQGKNCTDRDIHIINARTKHDMMHIYDECGRADLAHFEYTVQDNPPLTCVYGMEGKQCTADEMEKAKELFHSCWITKQ